MQHPALFCCLAFVGAIIIALLVNPYVVKMAYRKKLVDMPDKRKLQIQPIPVVGGIPIFIILIASILLLNAFVGESHLLPFLLGLVIMFMVGFFDDLLSLSTLIRFVFQILTIVVLWALGGYKVDTFNGLFGLYELPVYVGLPLSILIGVGMINAINMIDGINGLASGLSIFTNAMCAIIFFIHSNISFAVLSSIIIGALIPFFVCNVFSNKYKMFLGDAGALIMGMIAYVYICKIIHVIPSVSLDRYMIAFLIAIYSVPVFDTLRVMTLRMLNHTSPFKADKTHLHHIFVDMRMPHFIISLTIISINAAIVAVWLLTALSNMDVTLQFILILLVAALLIWGTYFTLNGIKERSIKHFERLSLSMRRHEIKIASFLKKMAYIIDGHYFKKINRKIRLKL